MPSMWKCNVPCVTKLHVVRACNGPHFWHTYSATQFCNIRDTLPRSSWNCEWMVHKMDFKFANLARFPFVRSQDGPCISAQWCFQVECDRWSVHCLNKMMWTRSSKLCALNVCWWMEMPDINTSFNEGRVSLRQNHRGRVTLVLSCNAWKHTPRNVPAFRNL